MNLWPLAFQNAVCWVAQSHRLRDGDNLIQYTLDNLRKNLLLYRNGIWILYALLSPQETKKVRSLRFVCIDFLCEVTHVWIIMPTAFGFVFYCCLSTRGGKIWWKPPWKDSGAGGDPNSILLWESQDQHPPNQVECVHFQQTAPGPQGELIAACSGRMCWLFTFSDWN